jgi:hypothetical protein
MTFQIHNLPYAPFAPLFDLDAEARTAQGVVRRTVTAHPGAPCRVSLADADVGETVILVNHASLTGNTPYAATHAIYVRENAVPTQPAVGEVRQMLASRTLSVRPFDRNDLMLAGEVIDGQILAATLTRLFTDQNVAHIHVHFAGAGCFGARVTRPETTQ